MRIPHIVFTMTGAQSLPGGIAAVNLNILHALAELTHGSDLRVTVLSMVERPADRPGFLPGCVEFLAFAGKKLALAAAQLRRLPGRPFFLFERVGLALALTPLAVLGLARTVIFAHGFENWRDLRRVDRWALEAARLVITNSDYTLRNMRSHVRRFSGVACPLGLSPGFAVNPEPPGPSDERLELEAADGVRRPLGARVLLLVARMDPTERRKGHRELIASLAGVRESFPDVQLVCAGPGDDRGLFEDLARRQGVASAVFFPGRVSFEMLARLYRDCYAFVMPSRQEGFGLVYLEAMNYAKPCVGCRDDGGADVIVDGETGLLVRDPGDASELRAVVCALLADPARAQALGARGFERLHARFTAEQFQQRFKACLAPLLAVEQGGAR